MRLEPRRAGSRRRGRAALLLALVVGGCAPAAATTDAGTRPDATDPDAAPAPDAACVAAEPARPPAVDLAAQIGSASVTNRRGQPLPDFSAPGAGTDFSTGGWGAAGPGDTLADGSHPSTRAFFLLPPDDPADLTKATFPAASLDPAFDFALEARAGIRVAPGSDAMSVTLRVVVSADPLAPTDAPWAVLASVVVTRDRVIDVSVPLGLWPRRPNFRVALQVECDTHNWFDALILDAPRLTPLARRPVLGVNDTDLQWAAGGIPAMEHRIDQMATLGVRALRLGMRGTSLIPETTAILRRAASHGMQVLIVVDLDDEDFADPAAATAHAGAAFNALCGWPAGIVRLSAIDPERFRRRITAYRDAFAAAGVRPGAIEVGNELDWTCFNGDIPLTGPMPAAEVDATALAYASLLRVAAETFTTPSRCGDPVLVTFGMANAIGFRGPDNGAIAPAALFRRLRSVGGVDYLDAYAGAIGEHLYDGPALDLAALTAAATEVPPGRPFYVTEWGVSLGAVPTGPTRYQALVERLAAFDERPDLHIVRTDLFAFDVDTWRVFDSATSTPLYEARIFADYSVP